MTDTKLDLRELLRAMTAAMGAELKELWKDAKAYASVELKSFIDHLKLIQRLKLKNKNTLKQAKYYISLKKSSLTIILLTIQGMSLVAAEQAVNSAINAVKAIVNRIIGWKVL